MIKSEVICDSVSPQNKRITTLKLRYPWFIHGELMTHRVFSRNASSNRAIPLKKMLEEVRSDDLRAEPEYWGAEQKGMEPGDELNDWNKLNATTIWRAAAHDAALRAEGLSNIGAHKSLCNRLLMPFTHANVIVTTTEWDNFFGLRLDDAADPTMRALAVAMWAAMQASMPKLLQPGQWHLPFVEENDEPVATNDMEAAYLMSREEPLDDQSRVYRELLIKISVARCARVSYESFPTKLSDGTIVQGKRSTVEEDLKLYDRLVGAQPLHASPAEHQATPDELLDATYMMDEAPFGWNNRDLPINKYGKDAVWKNERQHANFIGWRQYRKMLPNEAIAPLPKKYR